jgi:dsDNA-specific endonuclease/ATPase MutS2
MLKRDDRDMELMDSIRKNVIGATGIVKEIGDSLFETASLLRIEQSERVFRSLSEGIDNLNHLMDFIRELRSGMEHLKLKGIDISMEPLLVWDNFLDVFREMLSAFESQDWITLADLIQYEIKPLLTDGENGLADLQKNLQAM